MASPGATLSRADCRVAGLGAVGAPSTVAGRRNPADWRDPAQLRRRALRGGQQSRPRGAGGRAGCFERTSWPASRDLWFGFPRCATAEKTWES